MIKLVIFDMDGLLIDSERQMWIPNEVRALNELNLEVDIPFLYTLMGGSPKTNAERFSNRYGNDFNLEAFYKLVHHYNDLSVENNEVPLKKGASELLTYLEDNNINKCVGSSSLASYAHKVLNSLNIFDRFNHVITRDDVINPKPHPDIYLKCIELSNVDPKECLVLEDAHSGLQSAQAAGCRCILIPDLGTLSEKDYQEAYKVVDSLYDVIDIIKQENIGE